MILPEHIRVEARWREGHLTGIIIDPGLPLPLEQILSGRTAEEAMDLLPALFPICRRSHEAAARLCLDPRTDPEKGATQFLLPAFRCLHEEAMTLLFGLFLRAEPGERAGLARFRKTLDSLEQEAVAGSSRGEGGEKAGIRASLAAYADLLEQGLLREQPFLSRLHDGPAHPASLPSGRKRPVQTGFMPPLSAFTSGNERSISLLDPPRFNGRIVETGPLARDIPDPGTREWLETWGPAPFLRHRARLRELFNLPRRVRDLAGENRSFPIIHFRDREGFRVAMVETARGRLMHRGRTEKGRVRDYQVLSPTRWNFHPQGVLRVALESIDDLDSSQAENRIREEIDSLDPCLPVTLAVHNHA